MDTKLFAALIAFLSAIMTSLIGYWVAYKKIQKELHTTHKSDLIKKQMEACERLWASLEFASFSPGDDRIIQESESGVSVNIDLSRQFISNLVSVFHSSVGIYLSRNVRKELFGLRDFVASEFIDAGGSKDEIQISKTKAEKFRNKVTKLRIAIREEIGVEDLTVTKHINHDNRET